MASPGQWNVKPGGPEVKLGAMELQLVLKQVWTFL